MNKDYFMQSMDINGRSLTGAIFEVETKAGVKIGDFPVGPDGSITISNVHLVEGYLVQGEVTANGGDEGVEMVWPLGRNDFPGLHVGVADAFLGILPVA